MYHGHLKVTILECYGAPLYGRTHCPMPINTDQNCCFDSNANQCRSLQIHASLPLNSCQFLSMLINAALGKLDLASIGNDCHWSALISICHEKLQEIHYTLQAGLSSISNQLVSWHLSVKSEHYDQSSQQIIESCHLTCQLGALTEENTRKHLLI